MPHTYSSYLKINELLNLQECQSDGPEHDEMLFILIHQIYELWFKEILHELDYLTRMLRKNELVRAQHTLNRVLKIFKTLVSQLDVLETMTPAEFLSFRKFLESSSGFQSAQFRELEFLLGQKRPKMMGYHDQGSSGRQRLEQRLVEPSLWDAFLNCLSQNNINIPQKLLERDFTQADTASPEVQLELIEVYKNTPLLAHLCELLVDFDEGLQEWRYRHVKMVERTIGTKRGTGGSQGAEYLKKTLFQPVFPDLWEIRAEL
ncbi:MAG: tryptophan 2,3-dioxygenase family protein [SAR324 cluster bacterium]|nr:tryptophan 2,3-dioxygenase family protein [SAR324 cluster bacterium]